MAGMINPRGQLGNPVSAREIWVPGNIDLVENCRPNLSRLAWPLLAWELSEPRLRKPPVDLIEHFITLSDANPHAVCDFARRFGVLGLTANAEFPRDHPNMIRGYEPIATWTALAQKIRNLLSLAASLYSGEKIQPEHIAAAVGQGIQQLKMYPNGENSPIGWYWWRGPFPASQKGIQAIAWECLEQEMEDLLTRFPAHLSFLKKVDQDIHLEIAYPWGIPSVIALQLVTVVARKAVYFCASCKLAFIRAGGSKEERKPRSGSNTFCERCGRKASIRMAEERRQVRIKHAKDLAAKGYNIAEIQKELKTRNSKMIRRWIKKGK